MQHNPPTAARATLSATGSLYLLPATNHRTHPKLSTYRPSPLLFMKEVPCPYSYLLTQPAAHPAMIAYIYVTNISLNLLCTIKT